MAILDFKVYSEGTWYTDIAYFSPQGAVVSKEHGPIMDGVIVQFTGVYDKSRNKIYEYDVLTIHGMNYTVRFKLGAYLLVHPTNEANSLNLGRFARTGVVIGSSINRKFENTVSSVKRV